MQENALTVAEQNSLRWITFCETMKPWLENAETDPHYTKENVIAKVRGTLRMMEE